MNPEPSNKPVTKKPLAKGPAAKRPAQTKPPAKKPQAGKKLDADDQPEADRQQAAKLDISNFDRLPDQAMVPTGVFAAVIDVGESTVWRRTKFEPDFPKPIRIGIRCTRWRVGDIRAFIKSRAAQ